MFLTNWQLVEIYERQKARQAKKDKEKDDTIFISVKKMFWKLHVTEGKWKQRTQWHANIHFYPVTVGKNSNALQTLTASAINGMIHL